MYVHYRFKFLLMFSNLFSVITETVLKNEENILCE